MPKSRLQIMRDERLDKALKLREIGINPYPSKVNKDIANQEIIDNYDDLESKLLNVAGRITAIRLHGQLAFIDIEDYSGKIQLCIRADILGFTDVNQQKIGFENINLLDVGDFLQAFGTVMKTKANQISVQPTQLKLLTKSLRPLPTQHDLAVDPDVVFRRRYVDLASNKAQRDLFARKAAFWKATRDFLHEKGFIEVEVPVLEHITGGADAQPFTTHMNSLDQTFYLRISTELNQKRLIGGGYEKIYTFGPNFRNEGLSDEHLAEFYQIEWYWAYADYESNMRLTEDLFRQVANTVYGRTDFSTRGHSFDLADEWKRISYPDVIKDRFGVDIFTTPNEEILSILRNKRVSLPGAVNRNRLIDNLWKLIRKEISGPAFLINEPAFMSPLSKSQHNNSLLTERYHVIIAGSELANGYSELNNPLEQLDRFREQQAQRDAGDGEAQMLDIDFVEMLEYGMPPTSGHGHSERVFWFLEDLTAREGTLFPALKRNISDTTRRIYNLPESDDQE